MMEALSSSETSVLTGSTLRNNPEDVIIQIPFISLQRPYMTSHNISETGVTYRNYVHTLVLSYL
jgi:hypothetical protein